MTKLSDEWRTPDWLFKEIEKEHGPFDIDLCARVHNKKCFRYSEDYLNLDIKRVSNEYTKEFNCWINPPYSNPKPFIEKAWEDSKHCKIVCLVKCDPSTKWWAVFWDHSGPKNGCNYKFFPKRIQFDPPQQLIDSGEVWKVGNKWVQKCKGCNQRKDHNGLILGCLKCNFKGYKPLSGPSFSSALVIFDRRGL